MLYRFRSLHFKLMLVLIPCVLLALLLSFAYSAQSAQREFESQLEQKKEGLMRYPIVLASPVWNFDDAAIHNILDTLMLDPDILHVEIRDEGGHLVQKRSSGALGESLQAFVVEAPLVYHNAYIHQKAGTIRIVVGNQSLLLQQERHFRELLISSLLIVTLMTVAVSLIYSRLLGAPIHSLLVAINKSKEGDTFAKVHHQSQDELGDIANAFNTMQQRLETNQQRLINGRNHLRTLYHTTPSLLFSFDRDGTIRDASEYFLSYFSFQRDTLTYCKLQTLMAGPDAVIEAELMLDSLWENGTVSEYPMMITDGRGRVRDILIQATLSASDSFPGALAVMTDVTSLRQAHRELDRQANTDALSGLPNRNQFQRYLELLVDQRSKSGEPFALMFVDLDRFKSVNDTFGHHVGDDLIRAAAQRIRGELRSTDRIARLGGDEFAVVLETITSPLDAEEIANRILQKFEGSFHLTGCNIYVSASIGIACYPHDADTPTALLQTADVAMYRAKEEGRSRYALYSPEHNDNTLERAHIEKLLRSAVQEDRLVLHYQPIINLQEGRIVGAEVLLRLRDGEALIPPADFIPLAEETGTIVPIGAWCIEQACTTLARWRKRLSPDFTLSVNVSSRQFQSDQLANTLEDAINLHQIPAKSLLIEITESLLLHDNQNNQRMISLLDTLGCQIAIDDFGTGYSSLSYLMKFPLDVLKIDRSFVVECSLSEKPPHGNLVETIMRMGDTMGMRVITEGVESDEQMRFIQRSGGRYAQGFYFARPMPADQLEQAWQALNDEVRDKCQHLKR